MKNWKKTGIAALCVAALLAGCGTQGGKDDKEDDTIGADTPMDVTLETLREVNDPCVLLAKYDAVPVTVLLAALYWSESFGAVVSVSPP